MLVTLILSLVMIAGLFLMLYAAVALIQDKRFFTSAPKAVQDAVLPKPERFPSAHKLGWKLIILSLVLMAGSLFYAGVNGAENGFTFWQFFWRYLVMLLLLKAFDILFFDLVLLCHSNFFPRWYPEVKGIVGPQQFGYNWKTHLLHIMLSPVVSLALAWLCSVLA
jgi:hypothetical protein